MRQNWRQHSLGLSQKFINFPNGGNLRRKFDEKLLRAAEHKFNLTQMYQSYGFILSIVNYLCIKSLSQIHKFIDNGICKENNAFCQLTLLF